MASTTTFALSDAQESANSLLLDLDDVVAELNLELEIRLDWDTGGGAFCDRPAIYVAE